MSATKYLALIAGALLATSAMAGGDKDHSMTNADKFDQLDKDQDSAISRTEAAEDDDLSTTFASIDADGDGQLSRSEYTAQLGSEERGSEPMGEEY